MTLWQAYQAQESLAESINKKFAAVNDAVSGLIATDAARFSRLGNADEEIYAHVTGLMGVYKRVTELAAQNKFENAQELIDGICDVLTCRLREYEERASQNNPIVAEKQAIITAAREKLAAAIMKQKESFTTGLRMEDSQIWDDSFNILLQSEFHETFTIYRDCLKHCVSALDDLQTRQATAFYIGLVEREWEELSNIIKVQVSALEEAQTDFNIAAILDALREAYQQTSPIIENLQALQSAPKKKPASPQSFNKFEALLINVAIDEEPPQQKAFFEALDAQAEAVFGSFDGDYKKAAYTLQRLIGEKTLLADELTAIFDKALPQIPNVFTAEGEQNIDGDILRGIQETIEIKVASLKESIAAFNKQGMDIVKDFLAEKDNADSLSEAQAAVREEWLATPPESEDAIDEFFAKCKQGEPFAAYREHIEKQIAQYTELLEKTIIRFKKEVLLYEICTFEEILTHSVSRIRASENPAVSQAAAMLDDSFAKLEIILKKNNIEVIRPLPKDAFNAREHEVLVAEKQDGFEKGEIIKIITAGYRYKEQVILRANVIAAR